MRVPGAYLSKREQQIMEVLYQHPGLTANALMELLPSRLSNSTVRTQLRTLEEKGHVRHEEVEGKFLFSPVHETQAAAKDALGSVLKTFFRGRITDAVATFLSDDERRLSSAEIDEMEAMLKKYREQK